MKERPSLQIKRLSESLDEALKELGRLFTFEAEVFSREFPWGDPACRLSVVMDFLKWKTILIKEALKGSDFSEKLELNPFECAVGRFISHFIPPDEVAETLLRELDRVHKEVHYESAKLAQELEIGALNYKEIKDRLENNLFPLFNELLGLLVDLSDHLEKLESEEGLWEIPVWDR